MFEYSTALHNFRACFENKLQKDNAVPVNKDNSFIL